MRLAMKPVVFLLLYSLLPAVAATAGTYELITVNASGEKANGGSYNPAISDNGRYVVFTSKASNLVPNDTNNMDDVFLFDRKTKKMERVSLIDDKPRPYGIGLVSISGDGTVVSYVIYVQSGSNESAIFVYDTKTKTTERIPSELPNPNRPKLNADGNFLYYNQLGNGQLYVYDRVNKINELVTKSSSGVMSNSVYNDQGPYNQGRISPDGRYVSFSSYANNLVENDTNGYIDVFMHDRLTHKTERVSVDSSGNQYPQGITTLIFSNSSDFRYFIFRTVGSGVTKLKDRTTGVVEDLPAVPVSLFYNDGFPVTSAFNADGRYLQYFGANPFVVAYLYDRVTGQAERITEYDCDARMNADASIFAIQTYYPVISSDTNGMSDIYVYIRSTADTIPPSTTHQLSGTLGQNNWFVSDVLVTLTATDDKSGVKDIVSVLNNEPPAVQPGADYSFTVSSEGQNNLVYYSEDNADPGNKDSNPPVAINIDKTAPTITASVSPAPNRAGWYNTNATVTFACSDATSGIADCTAPVTLSRDGAGQMVSGKAVDRAGLTAETSVTVNLDMTAPAITINGVQSGAKYPLGLVPTVSYSASDSLSGVSASSATLTGGDGLGLGIFTYNVTAFDVAGNTATASATYEVIATPEGLIALIRQMQAAGKIDNAGIANSLISKVENAQKANGQAADNIMQAFINQVEAQSGRHIASDAAAILLHAAEYIISH